MNLLKKISLIGLLALSLSTSAYAAIEKDGHRFSLSGGLVVVNEQSSFALSAEYEYRIQEFYGIGGQASYVFSSQAFSQVAAPRFYLHPLQGDWYISASPVFYFGSGMDTLVGARLTTRMPLEINILTLIPTVGIDMIKGGPNYIFGLGIAI
jgi:hypothetical protein